MPLVATPPPHPVGAPRSPWPVAHPPPGVWTGWLPVHEALDAGHLDVPLFPGAYLFRITPAAGVDVLCESALLV